jgi:hypothetical protein
VGSSRQHPAILIMTVDENELRRETALLSRERIEKRMIFSSTRYTGSHRLIAVEKSNLTKNDAVTEVATGHS